MRTVLSFIFALGLVIPTLAAPPVANPDTVLIRTSTRATVLESLLANDTDPENTPLIIIRVSEPAFGRADLEAGKVSYTPTRDFEGTDEFTYTISDGTAISTAKVTIQNPFLSGAGLYSTSFPTTGATNGNAGYVEIKVGSSGTLSGSLRVAGLKLPFKGAFDANGAFNALLSGYQFSLQFPLNPAGPKQITGSVSSLQVNFTAVRSPYGDALPSPRQGRFTLVLQLPEGQDPTGLPKGYGYAAVRILKSGRATCVGRLGDNSRWSSSTLLTPTGQLPVYSGSQPVPSNVFGTITFSTSGVFTLLDGTLTWLRVRKLSETFFPKGFQTNLDVTGSNYVEPPVTKAVLDVAKLSPNATFAISGGDLRARTQPATLGLRPATGDYIVRIQNTKRLRAEMEINPVTGTFSGHFRKPSTGALRTFSGVVIQSENVAVGVFEAVKNTGKIELVPLPVAR